MPDLQGLPDALLERWDALVQEYEALLKETARVRKEQQQADAPA